MGLRAIPTLGKFLSDHLRTIISFVRKIRESRDGWVRSANATNVLRQTSTQLYAVKLADLNITLVKT